MIVALIQRLIAVTRYLRRQFKEDSAPNRGISSSVPRLVESSGEKGGCLEDYKVMTQHGLEGLASSFVIFTKAAIKRLFS
jgi:hypothetical protein